MNDVHNLQLALFVDSQFMVCSIVEVSYMCFIVERRGQR